MKSPTITASKDVRAIIALMFAPPLKHSVSHAAWQGQRGQNSKTAESRVVVAVGYVPATHENRLPSIDLPSYLMPPSEIYGIGADRTALTPFAIYHHSVGRSNKSQILAVFLQMDSPQYVLA